MASDGVHARRLSGADSRWLNVTICEGTRQEGPRRVPARDQAENKGMILESRATEQSLNSRGNSRELAKEQGMSS
jgi:hypothetical protein